MESKKSNQGSKKYYAKGMYFSLWIIIFCMTICSAVNGTDIWYDTSENPPGLEMFSILISLIFLLLALTLSFIIFTDQSGEDEE